jgi:transcriptional regulator with XRE-family HTH domain
MQLQHIGQRMRQVRTDLARQSQEDFAASLGMTQSNLSMIETGRYLPSALLLYLLLRTYQINLNWLFTGEGEIQT